ncbi:MAG: hypothetical protein DWQ44_01560 [Bacteroidetes bacterium]|nr:MAG: hypothetical protein DWQ33_05290 [Bacteroidota bacterium]REK36140.1 MAG: hypothetical protein DWQ44_01560 [Bacteroidota bacterium]REK51489.1 MAG: hypothetical protein DWQ48_01275 [Bacteroidota bacterium]
MKNTFTFWRLSCALTSILFLILLSPKSFAQTAPAAQTLPYTQNFSGLLHTSTTYPAGLQGWTLGTSNTTVFRTTTATTDRAMSASSTASTTAGGVNNYNGKIGILGTGSLDPSIALAINTTGLGSIQVNFNAMTIRNQQDGTNTRQNGMDLQYRVGTIAGPWVSVSGLTNGVYQNLTGSANNQTTAVTTPQNVLPVSLTLPSDCNNQSVVYLRWVQKDISGGGGRPSFAIDDISITGSALPPTINVSTTTIPDFGNVQTGSSSAEAFYTVSGFNLFNDINISAPSQFEISLTSGSGFTNSINLTPSSGTVGHTPIFVRFSPTVTGAASGNITHTSTGATQKDISVSGTGTSCSAPTITPVGPTTFCIGGSVELMSSSGVSYLWSNNETTQSIIVTSSGNYTVTVTDGSNCTAVSAPVTVTVNSFTYNGLLYAENMGVPGATTNVNTYTGWQNNGILNFSSTSTTNADVRSTSVSSGYSGASGGGNVFLGTSTTLPRNFIISGINASNATNLTLTFGLRRETAVGSATIGVSVSTDGINYTPLTVPSTTTGTWTLVTATGSIPSASNLRIKFEKSDTSSFRIDDVKLSGTISAVEISAQSSPNICQGKTVTLLSNVPAGNEWDPVFSFSQSIVVDDSGPGTYFTVATDLNGCTSVSNSISVSVLDTPTVSITSTDALCYGSADGTATAVGSGGTGPYTYSWNTNPVQNSAMAVNLATGTYKAVVTDINGCTGSGDAIIFQPDSITLSVSGTNPSTIGNNDGSATASASGGTAPYLFQWDTNNPGGKNFNVIDAPKTAAHPFDGQGSGTGYVIDGVEGKELTLMRGITYTFTVNTPGHPFHISTDSVGGDYSGEITSGVLNSQVESGILTFTPDAGHPSLLYYSCGHHQYMGFRINIIDGISTTFNVIDVPKTAAHPFFGQGSSFGYEINGVEGRELTLVRGITYSFNISTPGHPFHISTDSAGGNYAGEIISGVTNSREENGTLTFTPDAGHPNLLYYSCGHHQYMGFRINVVDPSYTATQNGLTAGTYCVLVTDANGCTKTAQITLEDPLPEITTTVSNLPSFGNVIVGNSSSEQSYDVSAVFLTDPLLITAPSGFEISTTSGSGFSSSISLTPSSGTVTATTIYVRFTPNSVGAASGDITHASTGATTVNVAVSGNGLSCPQATITPGGPTTFCSGGSVTLTASSGDTYLWSNNETTQSIVVNTSGTFSVVVTDAFNCSSTSAPVTVTVNSFVYNGTIFLETMGNPGGTVALNTYTGWANNGALVFSTTNNPPTTNPSDVRATTTSNYSGASGLGNVFMGTAGGTNPRDFLISGINTDGFSNLALSFGMLRTATTELLAVSVSSDGINYTPLTTSTQPAQNVWAVVTCSGTIPATSNLRIKFEKQTGVSFRIDDVRLTGTTNIITATAHGSTTFCQGGSVKISSNVATGNLWAPGSETSKIITAGSSGNYFTTLTDLNGCTAVSNTISLTVNPTPSASVSTTDVTCNGGNDGTATANMTGGTAPFTFSWNTSPVQTSNPATGLTAGSYSVTVTDANSCTATASGTVTQPAPIIVSSLNPGSGTVGTSVIIGGSGFIGATAVTFNGTSAAFTVDNDGQITATVPSGASTGFVTVFVNTCQGTHGTPFNVVSGSVTLDLKVYIQGYYISGAGPNMKTPLFTAGISPNNADVDTVVVSLMDEFSTSDTVATFTGILQSNGTISCTFPGSTNGNSYYIRVQHRNALDIYSGTTVSMSTNTSYDFSTAASQAFGSIQAEVETGVFAMYSGDVSGAFPGMKDGVIDHFDYQYMENQIGSLLTGYQVNDLDGDIHVEASDFSLMENNAAAVIFSAQP